MSRPATFTQISRVPLIKNFRLCRFTRLSGELFGFLIAVLFMQEAIKGSRLEFLPQEGVNAVQ